MGILSSFICFIYKSKPFPSQPLDSLAERMDCRAILERAPLKRYYKVRFLQTCCLSYNDIVLFDAKYIEMLSADELIAAGAHEFTHIVNRHGIKRFCRILLPPIILASLVSIIVFMNQRVLLKIALLSQIGLLPFIALSLSLSFLIILLISFFANAKWNRQKETECDLNAVKFSNGEAMISALIKANQLHPVNEKGFVYRVSPKFYPPIEQRINNIRLTMNQKN